jgi:hypothetical protein
LSGDFLHLLPVLLGGALSADREQHFLLTRSGLARLVALRRCFGFARSTTF